MSQSCHFVTWLCIRNHWVCHWVRKFPKSIKITNMSRKQGGHVVLFVQAKSRYDTYNILPKLLTWNLKLMVSEFGLSYSRGPHFQVNHVELWTRGVATTMSNLIPPKQLMDFRALSPRFPAFPSTSWNGENVICSLWLAIQSPLIIGDTASNGWVFPSILLMEEIRNNQPGIYKTLSMTGYATILNWLAGFLTPTVLIFRGIIQMPSNE